MQVDDGPNLTMESINGALSGEILARTTTWHSQIATWHRQIAPNTPNKFRLAQAARFSMNQVREFAGNQRS